MAVAVGSSDSVNRTLIYKDLMANWLAVGWGRRI
jgi:hypothetical protein